MKRDPDHEWTYREIDCRLYRRQTPESYEWDGYIRIGDEWTQVVDTDREIDESTATDRVESAVDLAIMKAKGNMGSTIDGDDGSGTEPYPQPYPCPRPDPDPVPQPSPWDPDPEPEPIEPGPVWMGDDTTTVSTDDNTILGSTRVM